MNTTIIGTSITIDGEITGDEELVLKGTVKGRVGSSDHVHIAPGAVVEANVEATVITVEGSVTGNLEANERAELRPNAKVVGDVRAPRVVLSDGANLKGSVDMGG